MSFSPLGDRDGDWYGWHGMDLSSSQHSIIFNRVSSWETLCCLSITFEQINHQGKSGAARCTTFTGKKPSGLDARYLWTSSNASFKKWLFICWLQLMRLDNWLERYEKVGWEWFRMEQFWIAGSSWHRSISWPSAWGGLSLREAGST